MSPYKPSPYICIGCGRTASKELSLTSYAGSGWIRARLCGEHDCALILTQLCNTWSTGRLVAVNQQRREAAKAAGTTYYEFSTPQEWLNLKTK